MIFDGLITQKEELVVEFLTPYQICRMGHYEYIEHYSNITKKVE